MTTPSSFAHHVTSTADSRSTEGGHQLQTISNTKRLETLLSDLNSVIQTPVGNVPSSLKPRWEGYDAALGQSIETALAECGLFEERPELLPVLRVLNPGLLGPTWFPFAESFELLQLVTLYVVTFFIYDDVIEDMKELDDIKLIGDRTLIALRAVDEWNFSRDHLALADAIIGKRKMTSFLKIIEDIGTHFVETMPRHIHNTFSAGNRGYIASLAQERMLLNVGATPSLSQFLLWRRTNVGGEVVALLAEFCAGLSLKDDFSRLEDERIMKITRGLNNMMLFQNDLASVSRDAGRLNLVFAMRDEMGIASEDAKDATSMLYQGVTKQVIQDSISLSTDKPFMKDWVTVVTATFVGLAKYHSSFGRYD